MNYSGIRTGRLPLVVLGALVALMTLASCGGSDKKTDPTSTATGGGASSPPASASSPASASASAPSPAAASASATASAPASASPAASSTPGGGSVTGSGAAALKALSKDLTGKTYRVTYEMTVTSSTDTLKGKLTLAQKPPKSLTVFDITESSDPLEKVILISDGKTTLTCFGDPTGGGTCIKAKQTADDEPLGSIISVQAVLGDLESSVDVTEAGSQTIAGADSRCFNVTETDGNKGVACFTKKDGILTFLRGKDETAGSQTSLKATTVGSDVPDSLFEAPKDYSITDTTGG